MCRIFWYPLRGYLLNQRCSAILVEFAQLYDLSDHIIFDQNDRLVLFLGIWSKKSQKPPGAPHQLKKVRYSTHLGAVLASYVAAKLLFYLVLVLTFKVKFIARHGVVFLNFWVWGSKSPFGTRFGVGAVKAPTQETSSLSIAARSNDLRLRRNLSEVRQFCLARFARFVVDLPRY